MLASSALDYVASQRIARKDLHSRKWLIAGILWNVLTLLIFKYFNFFVENVEQVYQLLGLHFPSFMEIALPIGISFFTFQKISYLVDVYREDTPAASSLPDYLLFVCLFPQLIAGPIVRYKDLAQQITDRFDSDDWSSRFSGLFRFVIGLSKKVLIADVLAKIAEPAFKASELDAPQAWIGLLAYTFQIYFDFSGYSDMAIGLGKMMGFRFPENFNWPYIARGFKDFWQRWHITLSTWMRDYLYIPLGGNRSSSFRTILNLWAVFLLSGFWHGASWNFLIWGTWHGLFISLDRFTGLFRTRFEVFNWGLTLVLVMLSWVWFNSDDLPAAVNYFSGLVNYTGSLDFELGTRESLTLGAAAAFALLPQEFHSRLLAQYDASGRFTWIKAFACLVLLVLCLGQLAIADGQPFIYFRF